MLTPARCMNCCVLFILLDRNCFVCFNRDVLGDWVLSVDRHDLHLVSARVQQEALRKIAELIHMTHVVPIHVDCGEVIRVESLL